MKGSLAFAKSAKMFWFSFGLNWLFLGVGIAGLCGAWDENLQSSKFLTWDPPGLHAWVV